MPTNPHTSTIPSTSSAQSSIALIQDLLTQALTELATLTTTAADQTPHREPAPAPGPPKQGPVSTPGRPDAMSTARRLAALVDHHLDVPTTTAPSPPPAAPRQPDIGPGVAVRAAPPRAPQLTRASGEPLPANAESARLPTPATALTADHVQATPPGPAEPSATSTGCDHGGYVPGYITSVLNPDHLDPVPAEPRRPNSPRTVPRT